MKSTGCEGRKDTSNEELWKNDISNESRQREGSDTYITENANLSWEEQV